MNSSIFVCALLLALVSPIFLHEPCSTLKDICEGFAADIANGSFEKKKEDFLACEAKNLGSEVKSAIVKCWEKLPMNTKEEMTKVCSDVKGNADKFAEGRTCMAKAIAGKEAQMMECLTKPGS